MSEVRVNRISPRSGGMLRVAGRVVFEDPIAGITYAPVNNIGTPGGQGFGVGIAPSLPAGMVALAGTNDPASPNYGNYQTSDGSIMVWVPAFFYKAGTGANGLPVNTFDIKPFSAYTSVSEAIGAGYTLHRAFYDGGQIKAGFFIDKFGASNQGGIAKSVRLGNPLSSSSAHNPFSGLNGAPANNYGGAFAVSKTRGVDYFPASRFMRAALAMLAHAHGAASTSTAFCAWYLVGANFPKGNNSNALSDVNDGLLSFISDGYPNAAKTGSGSVFAKTTHNGQESGVADVNGNMWDITPGITSDGTNYYVLKTTVAMKTLTGGNTVSTDAFGSAGITANYDSVGTTYGFAGNFLASPSQRFGNGANQVISEATSGNLWVQAGLGIPTSTGVSAGGTALFGTDFAYDGRPSELCPLSGGDWLGGSDAGVWALALVNVRSTSAADVGCRLGLYV